MQGKETGACPMDSSIPAQMFPCAQHYHTVTDLGDSWQPPEVTPEATQGELRAHGSFSQSKRHRNTNEKHNQELIHNCQKDLT